MSYAVRQFFLGGFIGFALTLVPALPLLAVIPRALPADEAKAGYKPPLPNWTPPG